MHFQYVLLYVAVLSLVATTDGVAPTKEMENIFQMLERQIKLKRLSLPTEKTFTQVTPTTSALTSLSTESVEVSIKPLLRETINRDVLSRVTSKLCRMNGDSLSRRKRDVDGHVVVVPSKWPKTFLSYRVHNHPESMSMFRTRHAIFRAFRIWAKCSNLDFVERETGEADINMRFEFEDHGDGETNAFDGPGGHLAHAHAPPVGEVHFDAEEKWGRGMTKRRHVVVTSKNGTRSIEVQWYYSLVLAAVHEIGHSLGLKHSPVEEGIMYPLYLERKTQDKIRLHISDVQALQNLYGPPAPSPLSNITRRYLSRIPFQLLAQNRFRNKTVEIPALNPCGKSIDAAYSVDGVVYFFKDRFYWTWSEDRFSEVKKIKKRFEVSKPRVDAACYSQFSKRTYVFSGQKYWRYYADRVERQYPRLSRNHGIPSTPDVALQIQGTPSIVIIKKNRYYIFDELTEETTRPQKLPRFLRKKIQPLDAALEHDGVAYFFSNGRTVQIQYSQIEDIFLKKLRVKLDSKAQAPWALACR